MSSEMLQDLHNIDFLAIGGNNFVCECSLRDFIFRARFNALLTECESKNRMHKREVPMSEVNPSMNKFLYDVLLREYWVYMLHYEESYKNLIGQQENEVNAYKVKLRAHDPFSTTTADKCEDLEPNSTMTFDFRLLDYNENDYHCIETNGATREKVQFYDVAPCQQTEYTTPTLGPIVNTRSTDTNEPYTEDDVNDKNIGDIDAPDESEGIPNVSTPLIIYLSVALPLTFICALWFWKRKDIRYFCAVFKNSLILSFDTDDKKTLMMQNRRRSNANEDQYRFDLFVSYSDKDREFVLDQLLPNLEKRSEIKICLHERDFQVGLSILENIIQCMDQSRCLLLVISESFLKSNWCSFEMHLAQHR